MDVTDEELLSYITESSMMSKTMEEYDGEPGCHPKAGLLPLHFFSM